jgi:hypothetical protein
MKLLSRIDLPRRRHGGLRFIDGHTGIFQTARRAFRAGLPPAQIQPRIEQRLEHILETMRSGRRSFRARAAWAPAR